MSIGQKPMQETTSKRDKWLLKNLKAVNGEAKELLNDQDYRRFLEEGESSASYQTYQRRLYEFAKWMKSMGPNVELGDEGVAIDYSEWDREFLLEVIAAETRDQEKRLSTADLEAIAKERGFPFGAFTENVPDIADQCDRIARVEGALLKDKKKLQALKDRVKELQAENRKLVQADNETDEIIDALKTISRIWEPPKFEPINYYVKKEREAAILLSDHHYDETVLSEETHGTNEYNPEVAERRINQVFSEASELAKEFGVRVVNVKLLGDMLSGTIHDELRSSSVYPITTASMNLADLLAGHITELARHFEVRCVAVVGNHGRIDKKPSFKHKQALNWDYVMYHTLSRAVGNAVAEFDIPESPFRVKEILGYRFVSVHGDTFKGGTGLNPISGTLGRDLIKLNGFLRKKGLEFEYAELGHFHTGRTQQPTGDQTLFILNGSLIGANEFSLNAVKTGENPSQTFYIVEEGKGLRFRTDIEVK